MLSFISEIDFVIYFFVAIGAAIIWGRLGKEGRKVYVLGEVLDTLELSKRGRAVTELTLFIILGCITVDVFVNPDTPPQAIAAGLGWTSLLSGPKLDKEK